MGPWSRPAMARPACSTSSRLASCRSASYAGRPPRSPNRRLLNAMYSTAAMLIRRITIRNGLTFSAIS
ncbi:hypothetical protein B1L11_19950 [Microbispora sp. GKU 823]|nr:hypothetical protein B1L11_19950 [Microbispora sp. GKU 823]